MGYIWMYHMFARLSLAMHRILRQKRDKIFGKTGLTCIEKSPVFKDEGQRSAWYDHMKVVWKGWLQKCHYWQLLLGYVCVTYLQDKEFIARPVVIDPLVVQMERRYNRLGQTDWRISPDEENQSKFRHWMARTQNMEEGAAENLVPGAFRFWTFYLDEPDATGAITTPMEALTKDDMFIKFVQQCFLEAALERSKLITYVTTSKKPPPTTQQRHGKEAADAHLPPCDNPLAPVNPGNPSNGMFLDAETAAARKAWELQRTLRSFPCVLSGSCSRLRQKQRNSHLRRSSDGVFFIVIVWIETSNDTV